MKTILMRSLVLLAIFFLLPASVRAQATGPLQYYALTPCRVVDTRQAVGVNGGPILGPGTTRSVAIRGYCGVPNTAKAVTINVTVVQPSMFSWLTIWKQGTSMPVVSTINFDDKDYSVANGAIVSLSTNSTDLSINNAQGTVHVLIDVNGYFQ